MKYLIILGDGMADKDIPELGGKTPLEYADTPTMDKYSKMSEIGMVHTIPDGMAPGSDTANLSVLGYNPRDYYTGRSPLEALSIGVDIISHNSQDVFLQKTHVFCCSCAKHMCFSQKESYHIIYNNATLYVIFKKKDT